MKLKLQLNIGKTDASRLGIAKSNEGETVTVEIQAVIDELLRRGWATEVQEPKTINTKAGE
jgi:hypothetical protein